MKRAVASFFFLFVGGLSAATQKLPFYENFDQSMAAQQAVKLSFRLNASVLGFEKEGRGYLLVDRSKNLILRVFSGKDTEYTLKQFNQEFVEYKKIKGSEKYTVYRNIEEQPIFPFVEAVSALPQNAAQALSSLRSHFELQLKRSSFVAQSKNPSSVVQLIEYDQKQNARHFKMKLTPTLTSPAKEVFVRVTQVEFFKDLPIEFFRIPVHSKTQVAFEY